jgi:hypothetical protein
MFGLVDEYLCHAVHIFRTGNIKAQPLYTNNIKQLGMRKFLLLQEIYIEAFRDWTQKLLNKYFKVFSVFCFFLIIVVLYAFIFRLSTGFTF